MVIQNFYGEEMWNRFSSGFKWNVSQKKCTIPYPKFLRSDVSGNLELP